MGAIDGLRTWLGIGLQTREEVGGPDTPSPASPSQIAPPSRNPSSRNPFSLSMVYRAISIHAIAAKQMGIQRWKEDVTSAFGADVRLPPGSFLRRPDISMPRSAFVEGTVVSLASRGNAYWRKRLDDQGRIQNCELLNPLQMNVVRNQGVLEYWYAGNRRPFHEDEIQHLKLLRVPGTEYGLGPIQAAMIEISGALDLRDYSSNWFTEGNGQPTGLLTSDQFLTADQAQEHKTAWNASGGGRRGIAVLGQGLHYSPIFLSPKEAQFLESMEYTTTQIARLFGVPASLMLAVLQGNSQTYANVEQDWLGFVRFSAMQYLLEIEEGFSQVLPRFEYARFNIESLLRADTTTRYASFKVATGGRPWMKPSEIRKIENLEPMSGIDDLPAAPAPTEPAAQPAEGTQQ